MYLYLKPQKIWNHITVSKLFVLRIVTKSCNYLQILIIISYWKQYSCLQKNKLILALNNLREFDNQPKLYTFPSPFLDLALYTFTVTWCIFASFRMFCIASNVSVCAFLSFMNYNLFSLTCKMLFGQKRNNQDPQIYYLAQWSKYSSGIKESCCYPSFKV